MITPLVSMTRQSHPFIGCSPLLDARCSLSRFSDTSSIAATDARYRLRTHGALGSTNRRTKNPLIRLRAAARQCVLGGLRCRHPFQYRTGGDSRLTRCVACASIVIFKEAGSRQLSCGEPISSQPNRNSSPQAASLRGFVRRFCFAFFLAIRGPRRPRCPTPDRPQARTYAPNYSALLAVLQNR